MTTDSNQQQARTAAIALRISMTIRTHCPFLRTSTLTPWRSIHVWAFLGDGGEHPCKRCTSSSKEVKSDASALGTVMIAGSAWLWGTKEMRNWSRFPQMYWAHMLRYMNNIELIHILETQSLEWRLRFPFCSCCTMKREDVWALLKGEKPAGGEGRGTDTRGMGNAIFSIKIAF